MRLTIYEKYDVIAVVGLIVCGLIAAAFGTQRGPANGGAGGGPRAARPPSLRIARRRRHRGDRAAPLEDPAGLARCASSRRGGDARRAGAGFGELGSRGRTTANPSCSSPTRHAGDSRGRRAYRAATSSSFWMRSVWRAISRTNCLRVRVSSKSVWNVLEGRFELTLANPAQIKNLPGRKSDVKSFGTFDMLAGRRHPPAAARPRRGRPYPDPVLHSADAIPACHTLLRRRHRTRHCANTGKRAPDSRLARLSRFADTLRLGTDQRLASRGTTDWCSTGPWPHSSTGSTAPLLNRPSEPMPSLIVPLLRLVWSRFPRPDGDENRVAPIICRRR
jgi:hypothetical protein